MKRIKFETVEAEVEEEAANFRKLEAEAEALHVEAEAVITLTASLHKHFNREYYIYSNVLYHTVLYCTIWYSTVSYCTESVRYSTTQHSIPVTISPFFPTAMFIIIKKLIENSTSKMTNK